MAGAIKTLFGALQASQYITAAGISLVFGIEELNQQRYPLPFVTVVPLGGPYEAPGYAGGIDPATEMLWETPEAIDFWIQAASTDPSNQGAIDHTDAIEAAHQALLSAFRDQRAQYTDVSQVSFGLAFAPKSRRWEALGNNAPSRFGRALVVRSEFRITSPIATPPGGPEATITSTPTSFTFVDKPAT